MKNMLLGLTPLKISSIARNKSGKRLSKVESLTICALLMSGLPMLASATSYQIDDDYKQDKFCGEVLALLKRGDVLDAEAPLCNRLFTLSDRAAKLGFHQINFAKVDKASYLPILKALENAEENAPLTRIPKPEFRKQYEMGIADTLKNDSVLIEQGKYDADNSGTTKPILRIRPSPNACERPLLDQLSFQILALLEKGKVGPLWVANNIYGSPFSYQRVTYLAEWEWHPVTTEEYSVTARFNTLYVYKPGFNTIPSTFVSMGQPYCVINQS